MPRSYPHSHLAHGRLVGFSIKKRSNDPVYFAYFRGPDGRRLERDTGQTGAERAREAARAIIEAEYAPATVPAGIVSWDEARGRLEQRMTAAGLRPRSVRYYLQLFDSIRAAYPETNGPADISPGMAQTYADRLTTGEGRGRKRRSAWTAATRINAASVVFSKWLTDQLGVLAANPFADVAPPKRDKLTPRVPTEDQVEHFHRWLADRFGGWELPGVFFRLKAYTGCRLADICSLRADQVRGGRVHFDADQTKGRKARAVPLPPDLAAAVERVKGDRFLWDRYPAELRAAIKAKGWPAHQLRPDFDPARMVAWVMTLFADYNAAHPDGPKLTSHQFRKLAFTTACRLKVPLDAAAVAFGCDVGTIKKHYLGVSEQEITDGVFATLQAPRATPAQGRAGGRRKKGSARPTSAQQMPNK